MFRPDLHDIGWAVFGGVWKNSEFEDALGGKSVHDVKSTKYEVWADLGFNFSCRRKGDVLIKCEKKN